MPPLVTDLTAPPVVGETYMVPCIPRVTYNILTLKAQQEGWLPVLGPEHNDTEVGFDHWHYHYDFRFIDEETLRGRFDIDPVLEWTLPNFFWHSVIARIERREPHERGVMLFPRHFDVSPQPLVCVREMPVFPSHLTMPILGITSATYEKRFRNKKNLRPNRVTFALEKVCAGRRVNPANPVCPHKGFPLRTLPVDAEGCVVCPLHGLKWNLTTGEMVSRYPCEKEGGQ